MILLICMFLYGHLDVLRPSIERDTGINKQTRSTCAQEDPYTYSYFDRYSSVASIVLGVRMTSNVTEIKYIH